MQREKQIKKKQIISSGKGNNTKLSPGQNSKSSANVNIKRSFVYLLLSEKEDELYMQFVRKFKKENQNIKIINNISEFESKYSSKGELDNLSLVLSPETAKKQIGRLKSINTAPVCVYGQIDSKIAKKLKNINENMSFPENLNDLDQVLGLK